MKKKCFRRLRRILGPVYDSIVYTLFLIPLFRDINPLPDETVFELITKEHYSLIRYGNGEIEWMLGVRDESSFGQRNDPELARRLIEAITIPQDNILIGIPNVFKKCKHNDSGYSRYFLRKYWAPLRKWLNGERAYCNTPITRCYEDYAGKQVQKSLELFNYWKDVWQGRPIVIIEGDQTRFGVGNDLLDGAASIRRILAPAENAFAKYEEILAAAKQLDRDALILIALGPTATVLAYDLAKAGYQAIDIGHLDIEYEWFLRRADRKIPIPGKYVNEAGHASQMGLEAFSQEEQEKYQAQVIARIDN